MEELVEKSMIDLVAAREEAEKRKGIAEIALAEIQSLKDQLEAEKSLSAG